MFNYIREIIINKPLADINRSAGNKIVLERVGEYDKRNVTKVWVTRGTEGTPGTVILKGEDLVNAMGDLLETTFNVHLFVKTMDKYLADYANANWGAFGKSIVVEFTASGTKTEVANAMEKALKMAVSDLDKMFEITNDNAGTLTLTFTEPYLTMGKDNIEVKMYDKNNELVDVKLTGTVTETVAPFATADWLIENLRFPSYPNVRYAAKNSDEYPVAGQVYDQVSFQYAVERPGLGGLSAVGQKIESVTTHVLYIKHGDADALAELFGADKKDATVVAPDKDGETDYGYDDITTPV